MKKILISAASIAVLTTGASAIADHNYVGLGLGWTFARAQMSEGGKMTYAAAQHDFSGKGRMSDDALSGKIIIGRAFGQNDTVWLTEAFVGLDSSKTKKTREQLVDDGGDLAKANMTTTVRRQATLGLSVGLSNKVVQDISLYAKASLLLSRFKAQKNTSSFTGLNPGGIIAAGLTSNLGPNNSLKPKTKWGFGLTVGGSKDLTDSLLLSLDYTFEMFQKIKVKGNNSNIGGGTASFVSTMKPQYHVVMMTLTQKF